MSEPTLTYCDNHNWEGECLVCKQAKGKAKPPDFCLECRYHGHGHPHAQGKVTDTGYCYLEPDPVPRIAERPACRHGVRK
jgi:hypothetical protein